MEFKQIPNEHLKLGYEEAMLVAVIDSWSTNKTKKGEHFQSQKEYCEKYHIKSRKYFTIIKKLKDYEIIEVVRRLTNNRQVLRINHDQLEFVLDKGYYALNAPPLCTNDTTEVHNMHSTSALDAPLECTIDTTHIPDKVPDNNTIKNTIKNTISSRSDGHEEFSFDIFKEEVKPDDIDLKLQALAIDFDNEY
jgi:hypothetical protein